MQHPWKPENGPAVTLVQKAGALLAMLAASVGFVVIVVWPLVAA